ncbi:hypothetical protein [Actinomadura sp. WMMB 499]|uniref:hypothetical protein n=1 Tax=Actinomadura sp. WMMB 499 TaxID=1219491 RepID=UPI0012464B8B|nr:hypothetical protein [Actinomadura sp. WMMB 499]QFG20482.1 hypothetical protein F7P10_04180 [Actinomadura sp. WMMB 499]
MRGTETTARLDYRLLLAVDIQGYSKRDARDQLAAQHQLADALDRAARGIGLDRAHWAKQVGGDGELATLPVGTDPAPVAGGFAIGLAAALREANRGPGRHRLRVRMALHYGTLTEGPFGPAGDAPIVVQRLLDAAPLRRLLDDGARDLAYVVSDSLFEDVVQTGFCALAPGAFRPMKTVAKGASFRGHLLTGALRDAARAARPAPAGGDGTDAGGSAGPPGGPPARVFSLPALAAR